MPAGDAFLPTDLGHLTYAVDSVADAARDADALQVRLDGLIVREHLGGLDPSAVRAHEVFQTSRLWKAGLQAGLALYHLGLGHFVPLELRGSPFGESVGHKFESEIIDRTDMR